MKTLSIDADINGNVDSLLDMVYEKGLTRKEMAGELGVSVTTISKRIADIQKNQGLLMQYRAVQSLQLTSLQAKILEHVTEDKIEEASLAELISSYKILKDRELVLDGKPNEIKGLVGYLIEMEKQQLAVDSPVDTEVIEGETEEIDKDLNNPDYVPDI